MRRRLRRFVRYAYPITAGYLAVMVTIIVFLLIADPGSINCKC